MTTSFDDFVRELEAQATPAELEALNKAREHARGILKQVQYKIERRQRVERFVALASNWYGSRPVPAPQIVTLHDERDDPFNHDGPCVEIAPRKFDGMRFTVLPLIGEVWAEDQHGKRVTTNPVIVTGVSEQEVNEAIITYIDTFGPYADDDGPGPYESMPKENDEQQES